jgi:hypothetical protein
VTRFAKERVSFLQINVINDISFFGTDCHHCCSIALAGMLILCVILIKECCYYNSPAILLYYIDDRLV